MDIHNSNIYIKSRLRNKKILFGFFCCFLFELFLGGSGQEIHVTNFLTLRMINFILAVSIGIICCLVYKKVPDFVLSLLILFSVLFLVSILIGLLNDSKFEYLFEDVKPLSFFYVLVFLCFVVDTKDMAFFVYKILMLSGQILIVSYLLYYTVTDILGLYDFSWAYATFESDNFMFRGIGSTFYYKGFVFIPIAAVGYLSEKKYFWLLLAAVAIFLTYTRGLYVLFALGVILQLFLSKRVSVFSFMLLLLIMLVIVLIVNDLGYLHIEDSFLDDRAEGDTTRFLTVSQVYDSITPSSLFFGHGFGQGVPAKPIHMEMSYLEIFHKQGIIGILFWMVLLYNICKFKPQQESDNMLSRVFLIGSVLMYIQSIFNPYINNPIGLIMLLLSLMVRYRLSKYENTLCNSSISNKIGRRSIL